MCEYVHVCASHTHISCRPAHFKEAYLHSVHCLIPKDQHSVCECVCVIDRQHTLESATGKIRVSVSNDSL